jgi:hypothetical protein
MGRTLAFRDAEDARGIQGWLPSTSFPEADMFARIGWVRGLALFLVAACAATLGGCGGGGPSPVFAGTLEVHNSANSVEFIVDIEVDEVAGPYYAYFFDQDVVPGESWFLGLYPSTYDVTLYWSDFFVETFFDVDIFDDTTTTILAFN